MWFLPSQQPYILLADSVWIIFDPAWNFVIDTVHLCCAYKCMYQSFHQSVNQCLRIWLCASVCECECVLPGCMFQVQHFSNIFKWRCPLAYPPLAPQMFLPFFERSIEIRLTRIYSFHFIHRCTCLLKIILLHLTHGTQFRLHGVFFVSWRQPKMLVNRTCVENSTMNM